MSSTITIQDEILDADVSVAVFHATARCADGNGTLTPLFFSDVNVDIARAKAVCRRCSLSDACLRGALEREEPWGVWGGELIESGRIIADRRPRGRPSVLPKPILVIDEDRTLRTIANVSEQRPDEVVVRVA
ncbi:unannotated protein [freshwater metagenome]|jgi:WhiB family redox-sensing transcriptional regulator|uniref:Unannotated protein n=1 Tax=freshwater metagenome TaxID=449393 RepID=A0A6J6EDP4_9ZZZZ|nr:WhiB family transcriptional regulator [Actinomycetota bacterium]